MIKYNELSFTEAHKLFEYKDGKLYNKIARGTKAKPGNVIGWKAKSGYISARVHGRSFYIHQIVFLLHNGYIPEVEIDHINKIKDDNRIENLREVSHICNTRNIGLRANNSSGVTGVGWSNKDRVWLTRIAINQKQFRIGGFKDFTEAVAHRLAAEQLCGMYITNSSAYKYMQEYVKGVTT